MEILSQRIVITRDLKIIGERSKIFSLLLWNRGERKKAFTKEYRVVSSANGNIRSERRDKRGALTNAFIRGSSRRDIEQEKEKRRKEQFHPPLLSFSREESSFEHDCIVGGNDSVKNSSAIARRKDTTRKCTRKEIMAVSSEKRRFPPHLHIHRHTRKKPQDVADSYVAYFLPSPLESARWQVDNFQTRCRFLKPRYKSTLVAVTEIERSKSNKCTDVGRAEERDKVFDGN